MKKMIFDHDPQPIPLRPMDPKLINKILTGKRINIKFKTGFVKALRDYNLNLKTAYKEFNKASKRASDRLEKNLQKL